MRLFVIQLNLKISDEIYNFNLSQDSYIRISLFYN